MKGSKLVVALLVSLFVHELAAIVAVSQATSSQERTRLARFEDRPKLGVNISKVARLRMSVDKTVYRSGDVVKLELSQMNISSEPSYFLKLGNVAVFSSDKLGNVTQGIPMTGVIEVMPVAQTYAALNPGEAFSSTRQLLPECDRPSFERTNAHLTPIEKGFFLCLDLKRPGRYTIYCEITNWFVLVTPDMTIVRTAVGTLRSNPVTITVRG
jgi:hypothetical protein